MSNHQTSKWTQFAFLVLGLLSVLLGLFLSGQMFSHRRSHAQGSATEGSVDAPKSVSPETVTSSQDGPSVPPATEMTLPPTKQTVPGEELSVEEAEASPETKTSQGENPLESEESEKPPVLDVSTDYRYEPIGKRDPFRPFRDSKIGIGQIRQSNRPLEPLEKHDVRALEVVAIIWGNEKPKALIQDPEKNIHPAVKGQRIGKNEGFIAEIREGEIVVVELFDLNGKTVKEPVVLPIRK